MPKLTFTVPVRLVSLTNQREHWSKRAARAKAQRLLAAAMTRITFRESEFTAPFGVSIIRIGKRTLDSDNLQGACKSFRDGIADALGVDDGDTSKVKWRYGQQKGLDYKVRVEIREGKP